MRTVYNKEELKRALEAKEYGMIDEILARKAK